MRPARSAALALAACLIAAGLALLLRDRENAAGALAPSREGATYPTTATTPADPLPDRELAPAAGAVEPEPSPAPTRASNSTATSVAAPTNFALRFHLADRLHALLDRPAKKPANRHGAPQIADSAFNPEKKQLSEHALRELQTLIDDFDDRDLELSGQSKRIRNQALYAALQNGQVESIELGTNPGTSDPVLANAFFERSHQLTREAIARMSEDLGQKGTDWYALQVRTFYPDAVSRQNIVWFRSDEHPELARLRSAKSALGKERRRAYFRFFRER